MALSLIATPAAGFKPESHVKTVNVALYDAMDGGICLPGLTSDRSSAPPRQIWIGENELQHYVVVDGPDGPERQFHNYLLHYAPYLRAGSVGPDAFPDPLIGQAFTHDNYAEPHVGPDDPRNVHHPPRESVFGEGFSFSSADLASLVGEDAAATLEKLAATFLGKPAWRSVDWGHEVLYMARAHYQEQIDYWEAEEPPREHLRDEWLANAEIRAARAEALREEQRAAVAFALGYMMHMAGDGQIHGLINEIVGLPWGYFDTRRSENPYYGLLAPMAEELQHMAIESYLDRSYFPGSEPAAQRKLVDGGACEPSMPAEEIVLACLDDSKLVERPVPCERCNPLRGVDPRGLSDRCDHCFDDCNPWRELCPATLPDPDPSSPCSAAVLCKPPVTGSNETCEDAPDAATFRACRDERTRICTDARMQCLCDEAVERLADLGIIDDPLAKYLCPATETADDLRFSGRSKRIQAQLVGALADIRSGNPATGSNTNLTETLGEYVANGCSTAPMNTERIYDLTVGGDTPVMIDVPNLQTSVSSGGSDIDLNGNGEPDLVNQCIWLNCRLYPHLCPWNALDRALPEAAYTDLITCEDGAPRFPGASVFGELGTEGCDGFPPGPTSFRPELEKVRSGDPDAVEAFINSTYLEVPKNFVNQTFYLNRIYTDPGSDAAPGAPGSYSLGGYGVNAIHAIVDALELLNLYLNVAIGDPWGFLEAQFPDSDVVRVLGGWANIVDRAAGWAEDVGDALYNSPVLNYTIRIPFIGEVTIGIGRLLAQPWYATAAMIRALGDPLGEMIRTVADSLDDEISQRMSLLHDHLRSNWVEATTCSAETITSGAHRHYSIRKYQDFAEEAVDILARGDDTCERPSMVEFVLTGSGFDFVDAVRLFDQFDRLIDWAGCEIQKLVLGNLMERMIVEPLRELMERASEKLFCDLLVGANQTLLTRASLDALVDHCPEIHRLLWHPQEGLGEPAFQTMLEGLDFTVETVGGTSYNIKDFVIRMRVVSTGTCWDGRVDSLELSERDRLRAAFYDDSVITTQCADSITEFSFDGFQPPEGVEPGRAPAIVDFLDQQTGTANSAPRTVRVVDALGESLVEDERRLTSSARFAPVYNTIQLNKLALLAPGNRETECNPTRLCSSARACSLEPCRPFGVGSSTPGGVREIIDFANANPRLGSGASGPREATELFWDVSPLVGPEANSAASPDEELERFFDEQWTTAGPDRSIPGARRCSDLHYNVLCNSIYSLDDPDDYCRQARGWAQGSVPDDACVLRHDDHDPCVWLEDVDDPPAPEPTYFPDPRADELVCDTHVSERWAWGDHARDYTPHQRSFAVDVGRRAHATPYSDEALYGYALTRFSLANKDAHVPRLYTKILAPFYCPEAGPAQADGDCDGIPDACDNCVGAYNPAQVRSGIRVEGDACAGDPGRIDSHCVLDPDVVPDEEVCPTCEDLEDRVAPDIEFPEVDVEDRGCRCGVTPATPPLSGLLWALLLVGFRLARRRRSEEAR